MRGKQVVMSCLCLVLQIVNKQEHRSVHPAGVSAVFEHPVPVETPLVSVVLDWCIVQLGGFLLSCQLINHSSCCKYYAIIKSPMCLSTVHEGLASGLYATAADAFADVTLVSKKFPLCCHA